ncbi:hypothetical protein [Brevundimonas sp. BAL3]|uniref:hypothetical protein n=1 Tax=Brevundimonas sp. BAL3 TaxID=391600 RepID=UPI00017EBAD6|nr:hypothetical protein [Brevundimonas sp. BAL3]EDX80249.1 hypothetical protein BBAL3_1406 [Brevundimonas sp. BAL3]
MSRRKQVLDAVTALIDQALPGADVRFEPSKAASIGPGGAVNVRSGSAEVVGEGSSPYYRIYSHGIVLELAAYASPTKTRHEVLDIMLSTIGAAITANRTLGGLVDWLVEEFPDLEALETPGSDTAEWASTVITAEYTVQSPLG